MPRICSSCLKQIGQQTGELDALKSGRKLPLSLWISDTANVSQPRLQMRNGQNI